MHTRTPSAVCPPKIHDMTGGLGDRDQPPAPRPATPRPTTIIQNCQWTVVPRAARGHDQAQRQEHGRPEGAVPAPGLVNRPAKEQHA
ncbi:hypothetical protein AAL_08382 [Moelleriella libera RCEF 2490]|uniref:Uncharacterized protein n=1 Tax=Moelleriella libera RCEF 2490 TaxID=1081109 RepID=A0A167VFX3_9HYPO|nr:hypothetical protein AAL_08382 [Moelleriella libera RCEF 2490]